MDAAQIQAMSDQLNNMQAAIGVMGNRIGVLEQSGFGQQIEQLNNNLTQRIALFENELIWVRDHPNRNNTSLDDKLFDPKVLMPKSVNTEIYTKVEKFRDWSLSVREFLGIFDPNISNILKNVEGTPEALDLATQQREMGGPEWVRRLYQLLLSKTENGARTIVRSVLNHGGLEAWRQLHRANDPRTVERNFGDLKYIMTPPRAKAGADVMGEIAKWEAASDRHGQRKGVPVDSFFPDDFRRVALMGLIPEKLYQDLQPQMDRFPKYMDLRNKIEEVCYSMHQGSAPMLFPCEEAAAVDDDTEYYIWDNEQEIYTLVQKGKGKGGKGGKGKSKGNNHKGPSTDKTPNKELCWRCGRTGHTTKGCYATKDKNKQPLADHDRNRFKPQGVSSLEEEAEAELNNTIGVGSIEIELNMLRPEHIPLPEDEDPLLKNDAWATLNLKPLPTSTSSTTWTTPPTPADSFAMPHYLKADLGPFYKGGALPDPTPQGPASDGDSKATTRSCHQITWWRRFSCKQHTFCPHTC